MPAREQKSEYTGREAQRRFEAALHGARVAGHKPKASMTPKRPESQRKKKKAAKRGS